MYFKPVLLHGSVLFEEGGVLVWAGGLGWRYGRKDASGVAGGVKPRPPQCRLHSEPRVRGQLVRRE